jgi:hypothetical protein
MHLIFEPAILRAETLEVVLIDQSHHVEKKWYIEYRIHHRHDLASDSERHQISESYRRCRDNCEVERVKITLSDRISCLKIMHRKRPYDPTREEYESNRDDLLVMDMERHRDYELWIISAVSRTLASFAIAMSAAS